MSTLRDPVGPKDRKVYVRRRILVLVIFVALIAVVVLVFVKPGSSGGAQSARQVEVPEGVAPTESQAEGSEPGDEEAVAACSPGQLRVTPLTDKSEYAEGEQPQLSLSVENAGQTECSADLGDAGMQFEISSGDDQVWRSVDCQETPENLAVLLAPGESLESEALPWDRTRSSTETCDVTRDPVAAGGASYHLRATAAGVSGATTAQFLLY